MVAREGIEPPTFRVWTERSSQLSYLAITSKQYYNNIFIIVWQLILEIIMNFWKKNSCFAEETILSASVCK